MNKESVLYRIKKIIEDNDLTNSEFAEKIGVPKSSISHLLSKRNKASLDIITKISEEFHDITTDILFLEALYPKKVKLRPLRIFSLHTFKIIVKFLLKNQIIELNQSLLYTKTINLSKLKSSR